VIDGFTERCGRGDVCLTHVSLDLDPDIDGFTILLNVWPHAQMTILSEQTHHHFYDIFL